ncbi:MAG: hypothetical protein OEW08_02705, partial [Gammaproteobacteria bacterium]|nr:hypothetical protein [Gammaproteobacteria bacterium]
MRLWPPTHSLATRIIIAAVAVELVVLALLMANTGRVFNATIHAQTELRLNELTPLLNAALAEGVFRHDYVGVQEQLEGLVRASGSSIRYLVVRDTAGKLFGAFGVPEGWSTPLTEEVSSSPGVVDARMPLRIGAEKVGQLYFGLSTHALVEARTELLNQGFFIAALAIFITTITLIAAINWMLHGLKALAQTT